MTRTRRPLTRTELAPLARAALGPGRTLTGVERLRGGTKKGVYRLTLDDDSTAVAYVWSADEDYWDQPDPDPQDVFSHGTGRGGVRKVPHSPRSARHAPSPHRPKAQVAPLRGPSSGTPRPRTGHRGNRTGLCGHPLACSRRPTTAFPPPASAPHA
ncbi:hypothetical protein [Streptomyces coeruleorubidus]|uniref:hypothetical protein n=1 Tax=Streptomyces coeruleorubidus TaxID=116188 RepID=UPI003654A716